MREEFQFTAAQATHALEVVLWLMKERRFFLYQSDPQSANKRLDYELDVHVFGPARTLDRRIRDVYAMARTVAERSIRTEERALGLAKPDLSGNKQLVQCNRYTGGLDICGVFPLSAFAAYVPESPEKLAEQCLEQLLQGKSRDEISPKELRARCDNALSVSKTIWEQLQAMDVHGSTDCVVLMATRFDCGNGDENHDFMQSRTRDMQKFPHALGYLFYMYSMQHRIVEHAHVVFSTSRRSHVNVQHWSDKEPSIDYENDGGYECSVIFVTVL